jgi:dihydropyrimidinase
LSNQYDTIVKNGLVVNSDGIVRADVGINGEKVAVVADLSGAAAKKTIDAGGCYVLPGAIDPHSHPVYVDDLGATSVAAAFGGVTSLIHFAYVKPGEEVMPTLHKFRNEGDTKSVLDYSLHLGLFDVKNQIKDLPQAFEYGATSLKVFMAYAKLGWMTDDYWLAAVMDLAAKKKGLVMVHAENGLTTDFLEDKYNAEGVSPLESFMAVRPDILEAEAINRAVAIARILGCALYVVHNSAEACLEPIRKARREGLPVIGETCAHYLTLTDETTLKFKAQAKIGPPLRTARDNEALWDGLADGTIETIGSDHAPKPKKIEDDFFKAPFGSPAVETSLQVIYDAGVNAGRITLPRLVQVMSENPARVFGLYPKKGTIKPGSDADLVVFDPQRLDVITAATQHSNVGYTLYEGRKVMGKPMLTMQRGKVITDGDRLVAAPGCGQFMKTNTSHLYQK